MVFCTGFETEFGTFRNPVNPVRINESWEQIDKTLQEALKIPFAQVDSGSALNKLRDRYPALKDISDDELMERIKLVYSKLVLCNMYLGDFLKADQEKDAEDQVPLVKESFYKNLSLINSLKPCLFGRAFLLCK